MAVAWNCTRWDQKGNIYILNMENRFVGVFLYFGFRMNLLKTDRKALGFYRFAELETNARQTLFIIYLVGPHSLAGHHARVRPGVVLVGRLLPFFFHMRSKLIVDCSLSSQPS